jgi:hypothetical protein
MLCCGALLNDSVVPLPGLLSTVLLLPPGHHATWQHRYKCMLRMFYPGCGDRLWKDLGRLGGGSREGVLLVLAELLKWHLQALGVRVSMAGTVG